MDYSDEGRFRCGSFYTAISRVKFGDNLYLKDFKPEYIKANPDVEKKMDSMKVFRPHQFLRTYLWESIFEVDNNELKLGYININDVMTLQSPVFINEDRNLLALDFLVISDTRLPSSMAEDTLGMLFDNWFIQARYDCSQGKKKHMGMLVLRSNKSKKLDAVSQISEKWAQS